MDPLQDVGEGRHPLARGGGEVGAGEEGLSLGGQEDGHRPAAVAREGRDRLHVEGVHIGALLAVDLDVHEQAVHQLGRDGVLEGLVRHDMAPVTGRVAHREQDGLVAALCLLEGLGSPRIPVDGVVRVLAEVGAALGGESVHEPSIRSDACAPWLWPAGR